MRKRRWKPPEGGFRQPNPARLATMPPDPDVGILITTKLN
jgi:hypothetical protein